MELALVRRACQRVFEIGVRLVPAMKYPPGAEVAKWLLGMIARVSPRFLRRAPTTPASISFSSFWSRFQHASVQTFEIANTHI